MSRPVIALLTDFGLQDQYVGTMKGVIVGICRDAALVDLTHDIPPQDIVSGALQLAAAYHYFPEGTVFLVVVDPGVGSPRRAIAAVAGDYVFVGPDNGVFTIVFDELPPRQIVELTAQRYARPVVSRTFEGRDRFAPAAAWLARGEPLSVLGPDAGGWVRADLPRAALGERAIDGEVVVVDRFGNLITNIRGDAVHHLPGTARTVTIGDRRIDRIASTYAEIPGGDICALVGSGGWLEVAVNGGSAAAALGLGRGARVHVSAGA